MTAGIDKLVDLMIEWIGIFKCLHVVNCYEQGLILRKGSFLKTLEPGLHFHRPFYYDVVYTDNVVTRTKDLPPVNLVTKDGRTIAVTAVVTCHIIDIKKALLEVESVDDALIDSCSATLGAHVANNTWDELRDGDREVRLTRSARNHARAYGVEIERVQFVSLAPCRVISLHQTK